MKRNKKINRRHKFFLATMLFIFLIPSLTLARTPTPQEMGQVKNLADQLKVDTDDVYVEAAKNAGNSNPEEGALKNLFVLKQQAAAFDDQIQKNLSNPSATEDGFNKLNQTFAVARDGFSTLAAYQKAQPMFDTIVDTMGNLRYYYVSSGTYQVYKDYNVYPYYPGYQNFAYIPTVSVPYYYRYPYYWHMSPYYYNYYPYRTNYRWGYGAYPYHYSNWGRRPWY